VNAARIRKSILETERERERETRFVFALNLLIEIV
jgi:predicted nucleic acid-binding Zn ribbon protein